MLTSLPGGPGNVLEVVGSGQFLTGRGGFLMGDIGATSHLRENMEFSPAALMETISCMHCMTVTLALDGTGLGAMWGEQKAREMLAAAGFTHVDIKRIEDDLTDSDEVAAR